MTKYPHLSVIIALIILVAGCAAPPSANVPLVLAKSENTATPYLISVPGDATPTPTPFQPLPPTPMIYPTSTPLPTNTPEPTPTQPPTPLPQAELEQPTGQINILLLGADARPWNTRFRTDTIILATLNQELGTLNLTSFPRDLWVNIPGLGQNRINTAWFFGYYPLLQKTFQQNFGVKIDHYVLIDFSNFKQFIDGLGGLDINVEEALSDYRNGYWTTIQPGKAHMDADKILWYVRSRKTTNDFARNHRQQEVLQAIFDKMLTLDTIRRVPDLYEIYKDSVTTDMKLEDILPLIPLAIKLTDSSRIHHYYVGPKQVNSWVTPEGAMVLLPVPDLVRNTIRKSQNLP